MTSVRDLILDTAKRGELHHAIILHGPHDEEMRLLARDIARTVNCPHGSSGDDCRSCQKIDRGIHPDVHVIAVADDRKLISIEQIRTMIADAALRPYEGKTKVFIVEEADAMSASGANALLKTLEEPAGDTIFILITRSADRLLPTIRSRSQSVAIRHTAKRSAYELADELGVSPQEARIRSAAASDEEGDAITGLVAQVVPALAAYAESREPALLIAIAGRLASHGDPRIAITAWVTALRDLASAPGADAIDPDAFDAAREIAPPDRLLDSAEIALRNLDRLSVNTDVRFMIEQSVIRIAWATA